MMGEFGTGFGWGHGLFGGFWMVLVWLLPILLIAWAGKGLFGDGRSGGNGKSALDLLKESYARGDIDREEFQRRRTDLLAD